jgi:hypothetical protein
MLAQCQLGLQKLIDERLRRHLCRSEPLAVGRTPQQLRT